MAILIDLDKFSAPSASELVRGMKKISKVAGGGHWTLRNELSPADLYCYLYAKFGPPNGVQNILRADDSDNLIHWDWTLQHTRGQLIFLGMNLRTEVHFVGRWDFHEFDRAEFVDSIKRDMTRHGEEMSRIRHDVFEDWIRILNPHRQLDRAIRALRDELSELAIDPTRDQIDDPTTPTELESFKERIAELSSRYSQAYGLSTALRTMTPILAEAFLNLLIFCLLKPEIANNDRLRERIVRDNIDIKVQSLHHNCIGFKRAVDWQSSQCKAYNRIVNERNDTLHGNIVVSKLKIGEVYFNGKVPIFTKYENLWNQLFGVSVFASGMKEVDFNLRIVDEFREYVLSCLNDSMCSDMRRLLDATELGQNKRTGRLGILFSDQIASIFAFPPIIK
jgi:hypothetical protein